MTLYWQADTTPIALHSMLRTLGEEYQIRENSGDCLLRFVPLANAGNILRVKREDGGFTVEYSRNNLAARGLAWALAGQECEENCAFDTFGILFDCTRGNVMKVDSFKVWLRRIALMGYNMAMLYVKDMYQLPGEPYFGYQRGAYSLEEMHEVDAYASSLGVEMIASIQALGHMEPILRWSYYRGTVRDTDNVLLVDEPKTMELLEKIINFWSEAFKSRRIHLGMDETHDLGRGRFMDLHGYESPFSLYNRHLGRVMELCRKHELKPIIWSDMYFRYANSTQNYYDTECEVPEEVRKAIPKDVQLSYWDYYHRSADVYEKMLMRTRALNGSAPFMASGVWTWARLWTDYEQTEATVLPCIQSCRKVNAREFILTLWGDDGGYCNFPSCWAGLAWVADAACNETPSHDRTALLFKAACHADYAVQHRLGDIQYTYIREEPDGVDKISAPVLLWDDPLMGLYWREFPALGQNLPEKVLEKFRSLLTLAEEHIDDCQAGDIRYISIVLSVLIKKILIRQKLDAAYAIRDFASLLDIRERMIPDIISEIELLKDAFRAQWLRDFKPYGLELMQIRLSGLVERYLELARCLEELADGRRADIEQLEEKHEPHGCSDKRYRMIATAGWYI